MKTPIEKLSEKFQAIEVDPDTRIITREEKKLAGLDTVHENWVWGSIMGESYIFANEDVAQLSDEELLETLGLNPEESTVKRGKRYTFVNFGFESPY